MSWDIPVHMQQTQPPCLGLQYAGGLRKKALLIGMTYNNTMGSSVIDLEIMVRWLIVVQRFRPDEIRILVDAPAEQLLRQLGCVPFRGIQYGYPSKRQVLAEIDYLVADASQYVQFFYFSGHGEQDHANGHTAMYEADGMDEYLIVADGRISDNEMNSIVNVPYIKLFAVVDCCHAGTIFDLTFTHYTHVVGDQITFSTKMENPEARPDASVVVVSGAQDHQEARGFENSPSYFTNAFVNVFCQEPFYGNYEQLLRSIFQHIRAEMQHRRDRCPPFAPCLSSTDPYRLHMPVSIGR
mmetsp:Transcript_10066/g.30746  ORF Transcript_10066/g.30746 Transcript_10066/m.30746 type:complete len:296 (+) Transcript_10066:230-1117(+)